MTRHTAFGWAVGSLAAGALVAGMWAPVAAEEVRQGLNAPMILQMLSKPAEKPEEKSGTRISAMPNSRARRAACMGPAPPKASSVH